MFFQLSREPFYLLVYPAIRAFRGTLGEDDFGLGEIRSQPVQLRNIPVRKRKLIARGAPTFFLCPLQTLGELWSHGSLPAFHPLCLRSGAIRSQYEGSRKEIQLGVGSLLAMPAKNFGKMKQCSGCGFVNHSQAFHCMRCLDMLPKGEEPYLFITDLAACVREGSLTEARQEELLTRILVDIRTEEARLESFSEHHDPNCEKCLNFIRRGLNSMRLRCEEAWAEGEEWASQDWVAWLDDCDEAEAEIVRGIDELECAGYGNPLSMFASPDSILEALTQT